MALTEKGNELLGVIQKLLEEKGDNSQATVEEIADFGGMSVPSVRGRMSKLVKEGFIVSEPYDTEDGKKRKRIQLTDLGWEQDTDNYVAPAAE
jgi:DNA-binding PadR family transcriptional regulator